MPNAWVRILLAYRAIIVFLDDSEWRPFAALALYTFVVLLWRWEWKVPAPGFAIGALGAAAALMTVFPSIRGWEKFAWVLLLTGFMTLEFTAIRIDRENVENETKQARKDESEQFRKVLEKNQENFQATVNGFSATFKEQEDAVNRLTGADSYPFLTAKFLAGEISQVVLGCGPTGHGYPLNGVEIQQVRSVTEKVDLPPAARPAQSYPFVDCKHPIPVPWRAVMDASQPMTMQQYDLTAHNGRWMELIRFTPVPGKPHTLEADYWIADDTHVLVQFKKPPFNRLEDPFSFPLKITRADGTPMN